VVIKSKTIWAEHVAGMGENGGTYRLLVVRLGRSRCRWEDNIESKKSGMGKHGMH
jgi:hypothetical protein